MADKINTALTEVIADVAARHGGDDVETVLAEVKEAAAARGVAIDDDDWLREHLAKPIAEGGVPGVTDEGGVD